MLKKKEEVTDTVVEERKVDDIPMPNEFDEYK